MRQILRALMMGVGVVVMVTVTSAVAASGKCSALPTEAQLREFLQQAAAGEEISDPLGPGTGAGGLFNGERMWGAVVNRDGELCAFTTSTADPSQAWPGSQAIAKAKAYTANGFSLDDFVLSTARLYTFALPGHSLFGLNNSNPFNPQFLAPPSGSSGGQGRIAGGIITFGGGMPLYANGKIVGGLGVSGDTSCTDHEIAKRVRDLAGLNPPGGPLVDDIVYLTIDPANLAIFAHPLCINTLRNGELLSAQEVPMPLPTAP